MAQHKFAFPDELLAVLLTDDATAKRLVLLLKDYEFAKEEQFLVADSLLEFTTQYQAAAKAHATEICPRSTHEYLRQLQDLAPSVHSEYVLSRLEDFLEEGDIRKAVAKTLDHMQMGEWTEIKQVFQEFGTKKRSRFDPGIRLKGEDLRSILAEDPDELVYRTGISALDQAHVGPGPKTLLVFIAPPKRGKSWFLINTGRHLCAQRKKVVHVTLEMNRRQVARRYIQNALSLTKREGQEIETVSFEFDSQGRLHGFVENKLKRPYLSSEIYERADKLLSRWQIYIKEFPTGSIDNDDLRAYLDSLEQTEHMVPDALIVDYVDLMRVDAANVRVDTSMLYKNLRGICMARGIAGITASQGNRSSANARWVRDDMVAEDWSKIMTADTVLTYSQTPDERKLGLARIFVSNVRDEGDKWACVITQSYAMGQFAIESARLPEDTYFKIVEARANGKDVEDEDDK